MNHSTDSQHFGDTNMEPALVMSPKVRVGPRTNEERKTKIQVNKNGTTIESIQITCACGEEIIVNCLYTDAA